MADDDGSEEARPQPGGHARFPERVETERLLIRPLVEDDITDRYLDWFDDSDVIRYLEARHLTRDDAVRNLRDGRASGRFQMYAICLKADGRHLGNIKLGPIDWRHGVSDLVTVIGDRSHALKGVGREAIAAMTQAGFRDMGLRKFSGGAYATNVASIRSYVAAGWVTETRLIGHHSVDGQPVDRVVLSCFNPAVFPSLPAFPTLLGKSEAADVAKEQPARGVRQAS